MLTSHCEICAACNINKNKKCSYCGKNGHTARECWVRYPQLKVQHDRRAEKRALMVKNDSQKNEDEPEFYCLVGNESLV